ncbi:MAG: DNA polymerase III subunit beta [Oscillospiraceae bacterium]|jgi:DNA polymerase-3 subunit beta|nr:DNA polymerase III subunit beta [Oscillospiraceae bacterium]
MKIICNTQKLSEVCSNVQRAVSSKTSIPAIEGILMHAFKDKLTLTGYDLEVGVTTCIDSKVEEEGNIIINARILCDILKKLPCENVSIEADERQLCIIKCGEVEYKLVGISADEYPELPSISGGYPVIIESEILSDMIRQTIFAAAVNDAKIVHTGLKFEIERDQLRIVAVDGFRLAIRTENIKYTGENMSFIVPAKTLSEVVKLINNDEALTLSVGKRHIIFEVGNYNIISRLLDGDFLDYNAALPKSLSTEVEVNVKMFVDSIERASLLITDRLKSPLRCVFEDNIIRISTITALGTASDKVFAQIEGSRVEIGFNNRFLLDALKACDVENVKLKLNGPLSPITIVPPQSENFLFLILPVRLKNES